MQKKKKKKKKKNQIFKILKRPLFDSVSMPLNIYMISIKVWGVRSPLNGFDILILFYILEWMY